MDFYGAEVFDRDMPSSYFRVGLFGYKPVVKSIAIDSVAAKLGLQRGDVILSINGAEVKKVSEISQVTSNVLSVSIFRGNEKKILSVDLPAPVAVKSRTHLNSKHASNKNRVVQDVPATQSKRKLATADAPSDQVTFEVLTRNKPSSNGSSQGRSRKEKQDRANREEPEKVPGKVTQTDEYRDSDNNDSTASVLTKTVTPRKDIFTSQIKPANDKFVLENGKGNVTFRHSIHLNSLNREQCMLCHRTSNSTLESLQSRLDNNRTGHSFCRGCHQKMDKGPITECHLCHNSKNMK